MIITINNIVNAEKIHFRRKIDYKKVLYEKRDAQTHDQLFERINCLAYRTPLASLISDPVRMRLTKLLPSIMRKPNVL